MKGFWLLALAFALLFVFGGLAEAGGGRGGVTFNRQFSFSYGQQFAAPQMAYGVYQPPAQVFQPPPVVYQPPPQVFAAPSYQGCGGQVGAAFQFRSQRSYGFSSGRSFQFRSRSFGGY